MNNNGEIGLYGNSISRTPSSSRPRRIGMRRDLRASTLAICALIVVASTVALVSKGGDAASRNPIVLAPGPPFFVIGYTFDEVGNPMPNCAVNITDISSGEWDNSTLSDSSGYYRFDMNSLAGGYSVGDTVNATAYSGSVVGWNETVITYAPHLWLNVTINGIVIPEFPYFALPIMGIISMFAVVMVASRRESNRSR
jgi:hypothetical protein